MPFFFFPFLIVEDKKAEPMGAGGARHTAVRYVAVNLPYYSGRACSHPGVVASSKRRRVEVLLPGGRVQFHVNPASTRPQSSTSLRKHRGRGDFSGSPSRSHGRESELRRQSELRRNFVELQ